MNYELFIAKRIIAGKEYKNSISSPIIKIAILAITLGMIIMLISVSIGAGFQQKIRDKMSGFKGHVLITNYDNNNSEVSTAPVSINQSFYPKFTTIPGIKNVQVFANKGGIIRTEKDFEGIVFKGVSNDYDWTFFNEYLIEGRFPDFTLARTKEVLLSKVLMDRMQYKLGDIVNAAFLKNSQRKLPSMRKYKIVGVYDTGFNQFDKSFMIGDIREVRKLNNWDKDKVGGFEVVIDDFNSLRKAGNSIYNEIGATLNSRTIVDNYPVIFEWLKVLENNVWIIIAIMIFVAGINMITALLVLILERAQMIGILKALGNTNWSIRKIFMYNATYLILRGLFWGNLIGIALLLLQKYFGIITLDPSSYYVSKVPVSLNILMIILLNVGVLLLCFLMLLLPSSIITKITPAKAIKFT